MSFGKRLREFRLEKNLRQEDLAKIIQVHRATIGKYETDERFPDKETLQKLADYFDTSVDYLLGRTDIRASYSRVKRQRCQYHVGSSPDFDLEGLPQEAIEQIRDYIEFIKNKYLK